MPKDEFLSNYINKQLITIPNYLNEKLLIHDTRIREREEFNQIKNYIDEFLEGNPINRFIVLPGLRGVGKSTLLFQTYDYLLKIKNIPPNQILYFSCEELNYLGDYNIHEVVENFLKSYHQKELESIDKRIFLLIDESQYDKNWALAGKILYDKSQKIFMIFTGFSALNLESNADAARRMFKYDINPLNFRQHLNLKYNIGLKSSNLLDKILFDADVEEAIAYEKYLKEKIINSHKYDINSWDDYLRYGGFPILLNVHKKYEKQAYLIDMISKIIDNDLASIKNFTTENLVNVDRVVSYLALQRADDLSQAKLSKHLQTSISNIKNILDTLEKTHLIFHIEAYGTSSKRSKKSWKYYFATSSLKHALSTTLGNSSIRKEEYEGILIENMVASLLNENFSKVPNINTYMYYDSAKQNVDFLIQRGFENPIPIEVGRGRKDTKQVTEAMKKYNSSHAIIVSNTTSEIYKQENIIYIPQKTFTML